MRESKAELRMRIIRLESQISDLNGILTRQRMELNELRADEHTCDGYCEGCEHLIETERIGTHPAYYFRTSFPKRLCALDRKCKDYKAKKES